eukprot:CAMPEP_0171210060 /NCGR_PEP_ID=MMETSP0790-20130122/28913_1 /TAXON_ID=2925 /ORGANISM="Alexandrium catenella, Strain OF101" /LENGTH=126 /DNA_ID=CAMNT_0011675683 /DNA_START=99 /DNA_END=476 /DNA_ORIENTATION=+
MLRAHFGVRNEEAAKPSAPHKALVAVELREDLVAGAQGQLPVHPQPRGHRPRGGHGDAAHQAEARAERHALFEANAACRREAEELREGHGDANLNGELQAQAGQGAVHEHHGGGEGEGEAEADGHA